MAKRLLSILGLVFAASSGAHAQNWGTGLNLGTQCLGGQQAGRGAVDGRDEKSNLNGRLNTIQGKLDQGNAMLDRINEQIDQDRSDMEQVLSGKAVEAIIEHRSYRRNIANYQDCSWDGSATSDGGSNSDYVPGGDGASGGNDRNLVPSPDAFCYRGNGAKNNTWAKFVRDDGGISESVCNYQVGKWSRRPETSRSAQCRDALKDLYELMDKKAKLEKEMAQLDANRKNYERRLNRVDDEMAEGTYRPFCGPDCDGTASSTSSVATSIFPLVGMLATVGMKYYQAQQQRKQQEQRMRYAPVFAPYPGPAGYQTGAYAAPTPGYYGGGPMYGTLPGSVGQGGFDCSANGGAQPFLNGGNDVFNNPFQNQNDPSMMNSMLMPGAGPGFAPMLGNGLNYNNPNDPNSLYMNPALMGQNPQYQLQQPFFQNQYQMGNNYDPSLLGYNPNGPGGPNGMNYNPNAPQYAPYMNGGNGAGGVNGVPAGYYYNPSTGTYAPGYGGGGGGAATNAALGNFYVQMEQLKQSISVIQNSPIYGGNAPAVLPYPGPNTYNYNTNPQIYTPGVGTPNIIRSR